MASPRHLDLLALLALSLIWGSAFALIKIAVAEVTPLTMAAGRIALAAVVLLAVQAVVGPPLRILWTAPRLWLPFLVLGMLGNGIPFVLIGYGETRIDSGLAALLIGTMPLSTIVLAAAFGVERGLGARAWAGIALGFAGLVLLLGPATGGDWLSGDGDMIVAQLAVVLGGASYAATAVYGRVVSLRLPVAVVAAGSMVASALVMTPLVLIIDQPWQASPGAPAILAIVTLGLVATALASLIYFRLLRTAGPTFVSLVNYLIPALGYALGILWLGESANWREIAALALILSALTLVRRRPAAIVASGEAKP